MKVDVSHNLDDVELVQAVVAARRKPVGIRAAILGIVDLAGTGLLLAGWCLVLSSWTFAVPDPQASVRWTGILVCSSFAFVFLSARLRARFTRQRLFGAAGASGAQYELTAEGLVRTTDSSQSLFFWSPQFQLENDGQRYFLSFGEDALFVVPARAFATYAEFEMFGTVAKRLAHGT